jgi:hypothetical protein
VRVTRTVARIIVVTMVVVTVAHPAGAECIRLWKDFADAKRRASLVFSGTVTLNDWRQIAGNLSCGTPSTFAFT